MAEEWGFSDARMAATLLKRQERMRKLQRDSERRKQKVDPMKRLDYLHRASHAAAHPAAHAVPSPYPPPPERPASGDSAPGGGDVQVPFRCALPRKEPSRVAVAPPANGMQWLDPPDPRETPSGGGGRPGWSSANAATGLGGGGTGLGGGEIVEELDFAPASEGAPHEPLPLRSFASDAPNAKLARSASRPGGRGSAQPTALRMVNNFLMTPPSSAGGSAGGGADVLTLPVGAPMRVARAARQ